MIAFPFAKINLGLLITGKRDDGFHSIESVMYPVGWSDALEVISDAEGTGVKFSVTGVKIPDDGENLCERAYRLLAEDHLLPAVQMHLHKILPVGAGLGGGSSDGTFALRLLNDLFKLGLSYKEQAGYAEQLGSDCPFFLTNNPAHVSGRGEVITPIDLSLKGYHILMIYPGFGVSTAEAYSGVIPTKPEKKVLDVIQQPVATWRDALHNQFEDSVFRQYPALAELKSELYSRGAMYAAMSGSGSTVFGIFKSSPDVAWINPVHTYWAGEL